MRILVFLLIFANVIFFAWAWGYFGDTTVSEAERLEAQIEPDRLHLMWRPGEEPENADKVASPATGNASAPGNVPGSTIAENTQPASPQAPPSQPAPEVVPPEVPPNVPSSPAPAAPPVAATACLLVSGLNTLTADDLEKKAKAVKLDTRRRNNDGNWWVFIPPHENKEAADKKASELRQLGVTDFFIVPDGAQKFAISLGVFSQEEGSRRHLETLRGKGVRSAQVERRSEENRITLEIRGVEKEVTTLRRQFPAETSARACS
ncbi:MAG: hypothetical protein LBQ75_00710 [Zoogloeaceae bacterium]|jgi:hypothetical protein|nr:hypothetical protein [Zoogloeaceae bacterium]